MPVFVPPYVFTDGTVADAVQVNADFSAVQTVLNGIDYQNIGPNGIYASQLLPTSPAQATFGGAQGYKFNPGATTVVPLTVNGPTGQTADLLDVDLNGTPVVWVDSAGGLHAPTITLPPGSGFSLAGNLTALTAAFGGTNSVSSVPLSVTGASGQTADILDVSTNTTKWVWVDNLGRLNCGPLFCTTLTASSTLSANSITSSTNITANTYMRASGQISSLVAYAANTIPSLSFQWQASGGQASLGASSSQTLQTVTGSALAFGLGSTPLMTLDTTGALGLAGQFHGGIVNCTQLISTGTISGPSVTTTSGAITSSTSVTAGTQLISQVAYGASGISTLSYQYPASGGTAGLGASSALSAGTITGTGLALGVGSTTLLAVDTSGNVGALGKMFSAGLQSNGGLIDIVPSSDAANTWFEITNHAFTQALIRMDEADANNGNILIMKGGFLGNVPSWYQAAGANTPTAHHGAQGSITAAGTSTTVNFSPTFATLLNLLVQDASNNYANVVPSSVSGTGFTFTSVNGHIYSYMAIGW